MRKDDFAVFEEKDDMVYLDSSATSLKPRVVAKRVEEYYNLSGASVHRGIYGLSADLTERYEKVRSDVASMIGAKASDEIIFTSGTTDSMNKLFIMLSESFAGKSEEEFSFSEGDEIIVSIMEHNSSYLPLRKFAERHGLKIRYLGVDDSGRIDTESFVSMVSERTKLVSVMHASNVLGVINPVKKMTAMLKAKCPDALMVVDGAQAVPHMKPDVADIGCDFYMFSAHKMCGPTGVGVLYGKRFLLERMTSTVLGGHSVLDVTKGKITLSDVPDRFEPGTPNISGVLGLGEAIRYLDDIGFDRIQENEKDLFHYAKDRLAEMGGIEMYGPMGYDDRIGLLSFNVKGVHPHDVITILDRMDICIRGGHHCAMLLMHELGLASVCRISFYVYNDRSDVDKLVKGLQKVKEIFEVQNG